MQVISWLTCDFYLVVASGIQLSLQFCCSVQQVSHVLSLSFPNVNREQPIHNLLLRQRGPRMLTLGCAALRSRKDTFCSGVTPQRGPSATAAVCWQRRWEWESSTLLRMVPAGPMWPPKSVWGLAAPFPNTSLKEMELSQALGWKNFW